MGQPTKIGKYEILAELGHGGMGVVYKALDRQLERLVAIKMIIGASPGLLKRFNTEARSTASLQHPNIVTIYEFGEQDGSPYLVMEFLEGMSLDSVIRSGKPLGLADKLHICVEICNGLHYAHERGIIHRDVKPANVMVLDDGVKIVDFGIARIGDTGISRTELLGSFNYMSPEQFQGQVLDRRVDIWSSGVLLYQLLTGALPFAATDDASAMYKILNDDPPPLSNYLQNYPPELDQIVRRVLSKNRDARYLTTHDLAFDLAAILDEQKHAEASQWLKQAEVAVQRTDWTKAENYLKQVLRINKQHTQAHQLLSKVQQQLRSRRQLEQLRIQADRAFLERRYDEALALIEQAISFDKGNPDLASFRDSIRQAKARAAEFETAFRQAQQAQHTGDLDEARLALQRALEIDPEETSAKALQAVIIRELKERERSKKLRALLDRGRAQITSRDLTGALGTLKLAESIDPASAEIFSLLQVVQAAREEQIRKADVEKLARQIEDSLNREDYLAAVNLANGGLQRYPQEKGLLQFKSLAEMQYRRAQLKGYAKEQFLLARRLLDAGRNLDALTSIENALKSVPNDVELETLRNLAKNRLAAEQNEQRNLAAREARRSAEEEETKRLRHIADLDALTRTIQAESDPSKLQQFTDRIRDLKTRYSEDSEVQTSVFNATRLLDARLSNMQERRTPGPQSATQLFGSPQAATEQTPADQLVAIPPSAAPSSRREADAFPARTQSKSRLILIAGAAAALLLITAFAIRALFRPSTSLVRIATLPAGATVTVAGQTCTDPNCKLQLREGTYTAEAHLDGYQPSSQSFTLKSGDTNADITLTLKPSGGISSSKEASAMSESSSSPNASAVPVASPAPASGLSKGTLQVTALVSVGKARSSPLAGADVIVDGRYYGQTGANGTFSVPLQPRQYTVSLRKQGYSIAEKRIDVRAGEETRIQLTAQLTAVATQVVNAAESNAVTAAPASTFQKTNPPAVQVATNANPPVGGINNSKPGAVVPPPNTVTQPPSFGSTAPAQPATGTSAGVTAPPSRASADTNAGPGFSDKRAITTALQQYKDAYESESLNELLKIWPSMSKDQKKALKAAFESTQAIKVSLDCGDPTILGDAATVKCNQEVKYTRAGKVEPPQTVSIDILLKRKQSVWLVSTLRAN